MADRAPVLTVEDLLALDDDDMVRGYIDGRSGELPPGDNRSRGYWHGWRVGAMNSGHIPRDQDYETLIKNAVQGGIIDPRLAPRWWSDA